MFMNGESLFLYLLFFVESMDTIHHIDEYQQIDLSKVYCTAMLMRQLVLVSSGFYRWNSKKFLCRSNMAYVNPYIHNTCTKQMTPRIAITLQHLEPLQLQQHAYRQFPIGDYQLQLLLLLSGWFFSLTQASKLKYIFSTDDIQLQQHEQYFYQQKNMRQQLQRIKAKDYSELDEKLYGNIAASSQLDSTISNLTQLQDYLKKMISRAENIEDKQTLLKASHVLYETQLNNKPSCSCLAHFQIILEQINKIKRYMKLSKDAIGREVRATVAHVSEDFHELAYFSKKEIQKAIKEVKIVRKEKEILEERVEQLMIQKEKLQKICNQWDEAKKRRRQRAESFRLIESEPVSSNQTPSSQKILTSQISSNHQLSVPQKPLRESTPPSYATGPIPTFRERNCEKQNYILRAKGVEMRQRQKSKKKIKLFSIL